MGCASRGWGAVGSAQPASKRMACANRSPLVIMDPVAHCDRKCQFWLTNLNFAFLIVLALLTASPGAAGHQLASISGSVLDPEGKGLPNVDVSIAGGPSATTDAQGRYQIVGVKVGTHEIRATLAGFAPSSRALHISKATAYEWSTTLSLASSGAYESLQSMLTPYVGQQAQDCGQLKASAPLDPMRAALRCVIACAAVRNTCVARKATLGIDSSIEHGLFANSHGHLYVFRYDSAPCGGDCGSQLSVQRCSRPSVVGTALELQFVCGD